MGVYDRTDLGARLVQPRMNVNFARRDEIFAPLQLFAVEIDGDDVIGGGVPHAAFEIATGTDQDPVGAGDPQAEMPCSCLGQVQKPDDAAGLREFFLEK
jgi:hypothetical protein